ncbi:MAG: NAD(P)-dependent oxidoreductase [Thermoanaerobaculum sp.]
MSTPRNIAFFGTGLMGFPMACRLIESGFPVTVWNRTKEKATPLAALGAQVATTPAQALEHGDIAILMLAHAEAIRKTLLAAETAPFLSGKTVVQMGTIGPEESKALAAEIARHGGRYLEAPVLGSVPQAEAGKLEVMAGGEKLLFEELLPVFRCFSPNPRWVGAVGAAATLKLALNHLIAAQAAAFATSLALVQKAQVPLELFLDILRPSAFYAPTFERKLPVMLDPLHAKVNFPAKHMLKDVRLIGSTAKNLGVNATLVAALEALYAATETAGLGDADYAAVARVIAASSSGP